MKPQHRPGAGIYVSSGRIHFNDLSLLILMPTQTDQVIQFMSLTHSERKSLNTLIQCDTIVTSTCDEELP